MAVRWLVSGFTLLTAAGLLCVRCSDTAHYIITLTGSTVTLDCQPPSPSYTGYFEWRYYSTGGTPGGRKIYSLSPYQLNTAEFPSTHYQKLGDYGLEITGVDWRTGGVYGCHFLTGDVFKFTVVVVIDSPVSEVNPPVVDANDEVLLRCSVPFGAPSLNSSAYMTASQIPRLTVTFNNLDVTTTTTYHYTDGHADRPHVITRDMRMQADRDHAGAMLSCTASTDRPAFTVSTDRLLHVRAAAYDIAVSPQRSQYAVNDVVVCTARGFPAPTLHWQPSHEDFPVTELDPGGDVVDGNPGGDVTVGLANLTITEEMMSGVQRWSCSAENELNEEPLMMTLEFTVTGESEDGSVEHAAAGMVSMVGVAVIASAAAVLVIGVVVIIIIIVCIRRKRRGGKSDSEADALTKQNLIYSPSNTSEPVESRSGSRPVPKPRAASTSSTLDAGGALTDGGGAGWKSSTTSLDRSLDSSDVVRPRPRARGSQEGLDRPPAPQQKPPRMTRGSQESLDRSLDNAARPRPNPRGSQESLDRLVDQRRPVPAQRGSQESLDRLDPSSRLERPQPRARRGSQDSLDRLDQGGQAHARGPLDRSLHDETEVKTSRPQMSVRPAADKKHQPTPAQKTGGARHHKDRVTTGSSDETNV